MTPVQKEWHKGFFCACAITVRNHGCNSEIEETIAYNYLSVQQMESIGVDQFDIDVLKPIIKEVERRRKLNI